MGRGAPAPTPTYDPIRQQWSTSCPVYWRYANVSPSVQITATQTFDFTIHGWFNNGGSVCYIVRVPHTTPSEEPGMLALPAADRAIGTVLDVESKGAADGLSVSVTVNNDEAAAAVPRIVEELDKQVRREEARIDKARRLRLTGVSEPDIAQPPAMGRPPAPPPPGGGGR